MSDTGLLDSALNLSAHAAEAVQRFEARRSRINLAMVPNSRFLSDALGLPLRANHRVPKPER
jgi:hypothetical protein